jgi:hypothetical protein
MERVEDNASDAQREYDLDVALQNLLTEAAQSDTVRRLRLRTA